jgi:hypothetical protein
MVQVIPLRHSLVLPVFLAEVKLLLEELGMAFANGNMEITSLKESTCIVSLAEVLFVRP